MTQMKASMFAACMGITSIEVDENGVMKIVEPTAEDKEAYNKMLRRE